MKAVMADYRAKVKQKESTSGADSTKLDEHHVKGPHIGGVWMGEKGKEMLEQGKTSPMSSADSGTSTLKSSGTRLV